MSYRPLPTKCWELFLLHHGYQLNRVKASHHQWTKKGFRTVPVWGNEKQTPAMHLKTSCSSMGISINDLYEWAATNC